MKTSKMKTSKMKTSKMKNLVTGYLVFIILFAICWITNIVQFVNCDFEPIGKMEIIKGIGTFIPPASLITVWF